MLFSKLSLVIFALFGSQGSYAAALRKEGTIDKRQTTRPSTYTIPKLASNAKGRADAMYVNLLKIPCSIFLL